MNKKKEKKGGEGGGLPEWVKLKISRSNSLPNLG
jgi:hypothetical protein